MDSDETKARKNRFVEFVSEHKSLIEEVMNEPQDEKIPGVYVKKERGRSYWYARITVGGKRISVGRFAEKEIAASAVKQACDVYQIAMPKVSNKMSHKKKMLITMCMNAGIYSHTNAMTVVYNGIVLMYNRLYDSLDLEFKGKTFKEKGTRVMPFVGFDFN